MTTPTKPEFNQADQERITFLEGKAARASELESQLEQVASRLMIANRDLDAANAEVLLHSKLRIELVSALGLDSLPPRGDNSRIFEAIEKLKDYEPR